MDNLEKLIQKQEEKIKQTSQSTFFNRNKKLITIIAIIITFLFVATRIYVNYALPRIYMKINEPLP